LEFLYRGVHAQHPRIKDARKGSVFPGQIDGAVTPEQHNEGGYSARSPYTSWTVDLETAQKYACDGPAAGVVLRVPDDTGTHASSGMTWRWVSSPDIYEEGEVLLLDVRINIEVLEP
jgi:hypothetical protein